MRHILGQVIHVVGRVSPSVPRSLEPRPAWRRPAPRLHLPTPTPGHTAPSPRNSERHRPPWSTAASYTSPCHRGHPARPTQPLPHSAKAASTLAHLVWRSTDTLGQSRPPTCRLVHAVIFF